MYVQMKQQALILEWCLVTLHGFFVSFFASKVADQITEG